MVIKKCKIPIYFGILTVVCADDLAEAAKIAGVDFDTHGFAAVAASQIRPSGMRDYCILLGPNATLGAIAHECLHIVNFIFRDIGMKLDVHNDEPSCYLIQWLFDRAHGVFAEWKNKPSNGLRNKRG